MLAILTAIFGVAGIDWLRDRLDRRAAARRESDGYDPRGAE